MMTFENTVGRFVEVRVKWPAKLEDTQRLVAYVSSVGQRLNTGALLLVDARQGSVLPQAVFHAIVEAIETDVHPPERIAVVRIDSAIVAMQMSRMAHQIHHGELRSFHHAHEAIAWLAEVATEAELRRMVEFVAAGEPTGITRESA